MIHREEPTERPAPTATLSPGPRPDDAERAARLLDASAPAPAPPTAPADVPPRAEPSADAVEDAICELVADPFLRTDVHGVIRRANEAVAALLKRSTTRLQGRPLFTHVHPDQRRTVRLLVAALGEASGPQRWSLRLEDTDGQPVAVSATVAPVRDAQGGLVGARWLLRPLDVAADDLPVPSPVVPALLPADTTRYFVDFLARATAHLGASLDPDAMLRGVARLAVPAIGDWCLVDVVDEGGVPRRLAAACTPLEDAALVAPLAAAAPRLDDPSPAALAIRTRRTQLVDAVSAEWLAGFAVDAEHLAALERLESRAWLAVPLVARGQVLGALTFVMAASDRGFGPLLVSVAEELARRAALSADNARLYRQAVRASEAKSAFLGTMSHELRTPLTAIIGYAELLHDGLAGALEPRQAEMVRRIRESSDHLLRLVEEVLGFARLQAREERVEPQRFDLSALAEQALTLVAPQARQKGLALALDRPPEPLTVASDPTKVRQILVNLLGNAVKFTDRGEVRVRVALEGPAGAAAPARRAVVEVSDTGIGIRPELLAHIFDPFWQAEQTATRARGGAGLGLSVVRQLAQLLGGDVEVESEPGRGSRFRVWLPCGRGEG